MSITDNILRVKNAQGVVTSILDRATTAQLYNQEYEEQIKALESGEGSTANTLFSLPDTTYEQAFKGRPIRSIPLDVAIRYTPEMSNTFTSNPVQIGVNVNDHVYNNPDTLVVNFGTSDVKGTLARMSGLIQTVQNGFDNIKNNQTPSRILLALLYKAKEERTLFQIDDGLRTYTDMVIQSITYDKDRTTYRALVATVTLQQFIFVESGIGDTPNGLVRTQVQSLEKSTFAKAKGVIDRIKLI